MTDFDVLVIGELNVDLVLRDENLTPEFGQKEKLVSEATMTIGSSSAIFTCQAARLGVRTAFVGKVGDDEFGRYMLEQLATFGIDVSGCVVDDRVKTGLSVILSRGTDRAILTYPGSIGELRADEVNRDMFARAKHLHVGGYYLLDGLRPGLANLLKDAKAAGLTVSLDPNWDPSERWEFERVWNYLDVFLPNETEARAISQQQSLEGALDFLAGQVPIVAVKLGERGAIGRRGTETARAEAVPVKVVDTVGAGDSFDAGFVYGFLHGWNLERSLQLGCVCGSLSTRTVGGTAAQPNLQEAMAALEKLSRAS